MFSKPDLYHGHFLTSRNFFEGWYTRITSPSGRSYAFIIGIAKGNDPHAFIQVVDGAKNKYHYHPFSFDAFNSRKGTLELNLSGNSLSYHRLTLNLTGTQGDILGSIRFSNINRWSSRDLFPGSMGVLAEIPGLECYSQVCVISGSVRGSLWIEGEMIDFTGGEVYMEKNWGKSFPEWWLWCQSSLFEDRRCSFTLSIGHVPVQSTSFTGLLACIMVDGKKYKFTTPTGATMKLYRREKGCKGALYSLTHKLVFSVESDKGITCNAPRMGNMTSSVVESLSADLKVKLYCRRTGKLIYSGVSTCAGLEMGGLWR